MKARPQSTAAASGLQRGRERQETPTTALMVCLGLFVVHAAAVLTQPPHSFEYDYLARMWGINNISYYRIPLLVVFYGVLFLVCLPRVNLAIVNFLHRLADAAEGKNGLSSPLRKAGWLLLAGGLFLAVSRLFHIKYNFLGDMDIRVTQTVNQEYQYTEFVTMWGLHWIYERVHQWFGASGLQVFQWSSAVFGVVFVWSSFLISRELAKSTLQKMFIFFFTISVGALQFFFGYAEIYPFPGLTVILFILAGVLYARNKVHAVVPILAFALAVGAHLLSVVFLPALVYLYAQRIPRLSEILGKADMRHLVALTLLAIPAAYVILPMFGQGYYLIPLSAPASSPNTTTLFSPVHLWEFLNSQLLAAGGAFLLLVVVVGRMLRSKQSMDSASWFLALGASFSIVSAFITNAVRGSGDWDILAFPSIVYVTWVVAMYLDQARAGKDVPKAFAVLVVVLTYNVMNLASWIGINASDRSIQKIEDMLVGDPGNYYEQTLAVPLSLAFNYRGNGLQEKAGEYFRIACERNPQDPRTFYNYANFLFAQKQDSLAVANLEYLAATLPGYPRSYPVLVDYYNQAHNVPALVRILERLFGAYLQNPKLFSSTIPKSDLVRWFSYLQTVESANKNEKAVQIIQQQLAKLQ